MVESKQAAVAGWAELGTLELTGDCDMQVHRADWSEMPHDAHFPELVKNAIDFLQLAVENIRKDDIKHSTINFHQAIELFVKARLLCEHWALIVEKTDDADRISFNRGDFQSVTLERAIGRIEKLTGEDLAALRVCMKPIKERRNRYVHFYNTRTIVSLRHDQAKSRVESVLLSKQETITNEKSIAIAEQCKAWYALIQLLTGRWSSYFVPFQDKLRDIDRMMLAVRAYLKTKYESTRPLIEESEAAGNVVGDCESCGYKAVIIEKVCRGVFDSSCVVCDCRIRELQLNCIDSCCDGLVRVRFDLDPECVKCGRYHTIEDQCEALARGGPVSWCPRCDPDRETGGTRVVVDGDGVKLCVICLGLSTG